MIPKLFGASSRQRRTKDYERILASSNSTQDFRQFLYASIKLRYLERKVWKVLVLDKSVDRDTEADGPGSQLNEIKK